MRCAQIETYSCAQLVLILGLCITGGHALSGSWSEEEDGSSILDLQGQSVPGLEQEPESPPSLAEGAVCLSRVHPVSMDNFPDFEDGAVAAGLIQTHETRVPHYHVERLRQVHETHRAPAFSLVEEDWQELAALNQSSSNDNENKAQGYAAIRMTNLKDSQYVGPLKVGSQGDILSVVYDTGSTNLWFASTLCKAGPCLKRRRYDPTSSNTYHEGFYDLEVKFGTGRLTGVQGIDDVEMSGFKVKQQTFSMIQTEEGSVFEQLDFEGILGLAFPAMSANGVAPFFDQVMQQKLLKRNAVSFYFTKLPTDASAVFFGEVDRNLYSGEQIGFPVTEQYYWIVDLKQFKIGDKVMEGPRKVVFDTGTTYYTAPKSLLKTVLKELPQTPCEDIRQGKSQLRDMTWTLVAHGGKEVDIVVPPSDYMVGSGRDSMCDPTWMPIDVPSPHGPAWIFGEAFMRSFFTTFHRGDGSANPEVRIAPSNPDAIKLVQQLKKMEGMSVNQLKQQKAQEALIQTHRNLRTSA